MMGQFGGLLESFWCHFWAILNLGDPFWGPLLSLGAILGSTSDFDAILPTSEKHLSPFGGPF